MIGDRLDTDILLGKNAGVDTCLVLTGVSKIDHFVNEKKSKDGIIPKYVCKEVCCDRILKD